MTDDRLEAIKARHAAALSSTAPTYDFYELTADLGYLIDEVERLRGTVGKLREDLRNEHRLCPEKSTRLLLWRFNAQLDEILAPRSRKQPEVLA